MASTSVRIPRLLAQLTGGVERVAVEADTVSGALEALFEQYPQLRVHVFDEQRAVRPHVMVFHGPDVVRSEEEWGSPLSDGSEVTVLQAVSGG